MTDLKLYELPPSPNNMKARIALNYKGLDFESIPIDPQDRSLAVEISGQPLTPILVHDQTVVYDSAAILRYLDANFRDTPPLFSADAEEMKKIERLESFARTDLVQPIGMTFEQAFAPEPNLEAVKRASDLLHERTARFEDLLANQDWLCGDRLTAADVTAAPVVHYGMLPDDAPTEIPVVAFFKEHLDLGGKREKTRAWVQRVMNHL